MRKRPVRPPLAAAPAPRAPRRPPHERELPQAPPRTAAGAPPLSRPTRAPKQRPVGKVPNPRKPKLVRDVHGNELGDLFELFPDLPRPARPAPRVQLRDRRAKRAPHR